MTAKSANELREVPRQRGDDEHHRCIDALLIAARGVFQTLGSR